MKISQKLSKFCRIQNWEYLLKYKLDRRKAIFPKLKILQLCLAVKEVLENQLLLLTQQLLQNKVVRELAFLIVIFMDLLCQLLQSPEEDPKSVFPLDFEGLQCMSFGFLRNQKAVMRGVLAASITKELINKTIWENLDYLIIDMPPGTGDIQIQLCQDIPITGAVIVTTPQKLSYIDVVKGIEMFGDVKVPTLAIVENMSYFICNNCSQKHKIWGETEHLDLVTKQFGIKNKFQFGIDPLISQYCDSGTPYVFVLPQKACQQFYDLAETVIQEAEIVKQLKNPEIIYNETSKKIEVKYSQDKTTYIDPYELRQKCMCVDCLGKIQANIPKEVHPLQIQKKGNYAVGVYWSDGHNSSIYPYSNLEKIAK